MNTAVTSLPRTVTGDAAATAGARFRRRVGQVAKAAWQALDAAGRARAHRHMMDFADRCEVLQPELAKELRAASRQSLSA